MVASKPPPRSLGGDLEITTTARSEDIFATLLKRTRSIEPKGQSYRSDIRCRSLAGPSHADECLCAPFAWGLHPGDLRAVRAENSLRFFIQQHRDQAG